MKRMCWPSRTAWVVGITVVGTFLADDASAVEVGAEKGAVGNLDYEVRLDEDSGGVEACFTAAAEAASAAGGDATGNALPTEDAASLDGSTPELDLGGISGAGDGTVCVTLVPPATPSLPDVPDSGSPEPASAAVHVGIPTPEGVTEVDFGTFADPEEATVCAAISAAGDGVEPESVEVCLPPSSGDASTTPGLDADPLDPSLPGAAGLPIPRASLAQCLSEELPGLTSNEILERLPLLGGGEGSPLSGLSVLGGETSTPAGLPIR